MEALVAGRSANHAWIAALALAQVETGAVEAGREHYEALVADGLRAVPRDWYWFFTASCSPRPRCALRDRERAAQLYDLLAPYADRYVQVIFAANWGSVQRVLGMLAGVLERHDDAEGHFRAGARGQRAHRRGAHDGRDAVRVRRAAAGARRRRATASGRRRSPALVERFAAPRGLEGLRRRAGALSRAAVMMRRRVYLRHAARALYCA